MPYNVIDINYHPKPKNTKGRLREVPVEGGFVAYVLLDKGLKS